MEKLIKITREFNLGQIQKFNKLDGGIINTTYQVTTDKGIFIIQGLHKIFNENIIEDYRNIYEYLRQYDFPIPQILNTKDNKYFIKEDGEVWRVFTYIEHDSNPVVTEKMIFKSGQTLGRLHELLSNFNYQPKFQIENFHNTERIIERLKKVVEESTNKKSSLVLDEYQTIIDNVSKHFLPTNLKKTLIHADPKIENFLFKNGEVISLIDWDTMMVSNAMVDLGDALTSWCIEESSKFNQDKYYSALKGYFGENEASCDFGLTKDALCLITLELAARFLTDYFEENYFDWDSRRYKTAAEHNLERARQYIKYYHNITKKLNQY